MNKSRAAPEVLLYYCLEYVAAIMAMTFSRPTLADRTAYENLAGETPEILEYIEFEFHRWVTYWDPTAKQPREHLGKWLGVAIIGF